MSGTFEVDGDWLVLRSPLGDHRVRLGIANPQKLAARLRRNVCTKAKGDAPDPLVDICCAPSASDKARQMIDVQRDKIAAMAADDPQRADEERILDQMIATSRQIDNAGLLLDPPA